jgi:hypothetical protein
MSPLPFSSLKNGCLKLSYADVWPKFSAQLIANKRRPEHMPPSKTGSDSMRARLGKKSKRLLQPP